jgi:hypothetical protein
MVSKEEKPPTSKEEDDKPPTSKEEAYARRKRPPPEKYDPDSYSYWSITMMVAWIIWREIDAVRNEWDDYREKCADWRHVPDATARAKLVIPDLQKDLRKESPWHLHSWEFSGWKLLRLKAIKENVLEPHQRALRPLQVAINELRQAAGEGRIKATALQCKNAKTFDGDLIEIPVHYWPYLTRRRSVDRKGDADRRQWPGLPRG